VSIGPEPTSLAVARLGARGEAEYEFVIAGTAAPQLASALRLPAGVEAICAGSLGLVLEPMATTILELVERERGRRPIVIDPNIRPGLIPDVEYRARLRRFLRGATIVKASDADLAWLFEGLGHEAAAERLLDDGARLVVVTRGADGAFGAHGDLRVAVPAPRVDVADTIGAGDAFGAALLARLLQRRLLTMEMDLSEAELRGALGYACQVTATTLSDAV